jgi:hypothetical protein
VSIVAIDHCGYECDKEFEDYGISPFMYVSFAAPFAGLSLSLSQNKLVDEHEERGFFSSR